MKIHSILLVLLLLISCEKKSQPIPIDKIRQKNEVISHLRFLSSNELKGRKVGKPETKIAARYIAEQFRIAGLQSFNRDNDYLQSVKLEIEDKTILCNNVVGFKEGTNPKLKDEYILLCAHYDHLGIKKNPKPEISDSIYNGARDNAMGVTALIYAANQLSKFTTKRSIIFLATTGEEEGMLGSDYFIRHCPVSFKKIVFVLNNDGGGFNDTTNVRIGGENKIDFPAGFWHSFENSIKFLPYPDKLEYLYEKGDNITFANKGIPSITISPGFNKINEDILKYIHQPEDEMNDDFDTNYLLNFSRVYFDCALKLANYRTMPTWKKNCKYFSVLKTYQKKQGKLPLREKINKTIL